MDIGDERGVPVCCRTGKVAPMTYVGEERVRLKKGALHGGPD